MAQVETLSKQLVEKALRAKPYHFMIDSEGDYRINFKPESPLGRFNGIIAVGGPHDEMLKCYGFFDLEIPPEQVSQAIVLCNGYHTAHYFPNVYVRQDTEGDRNGSFWSQNVIDCECGIHQEAVLNGVVQFFAAVGAFEQWIVKQPQFWL
jgi:hypothetical protein